MFSDTREPLTEVSSQLLVVLLDQNSEHQTPAPATQSPSEEGFLEQTPEVTKTESCIFTLSQPR